MGCIATIAAWAFTLCAEATDYHRLTQLPAMYIETFDGKPVLDHDVYKYCKLAFVTEDNTVTVFDTVKIRGRGNTTWNMDKKPYRIKFLKKQKLLGKGFAKAKSWVLLANAGDKLMLRNGLSTYAGQLMKMPFTPADKFIDLMVNGDYRGTYQLTDQIQIHPHRVNIVEQDTAVTNPLTDITGGYLLEPEGLTAPDGLYFDTANGCHIRIHSPDPDIINKRQESYIKTFIDRFENALYSSTFTSTTKGYRQYTDTTSLIDWYLVNEISGNPDGFWCSYIYKERDEDKIHFGPIWDFDICYNNCSRQGDVTRKLAIQFGYGSNYTIKGWFSRMWNDPWFKGAVCARFDDLRKQGLEEKMCHYVDSMSAKINESQEQNYRIWSIDKKYYDEIYIYSSYAEYADQVKRFIREHCAWLAGEFHRRLGERPSTNFYPSKDYCYKFHSKAFPNKVFAPENDLRDKPAAVALYDETEDNTLQMWNVYLAGGYYVIVNEQTGMALTDMGNTTTTTQLQTAPLDTTNHRQHWTFVPQSTGNSYNVKNLMTGNIVYNTNGMADNGNPTSGTAGTTADKSNKNRLWVPASIGRPQLSAVEAAEAEEDYALAYSNNGNRLRFIAHDRSLLTFTAHIYNAEGKVMGQFRGNETFNTDHLPAGIYIVSWKFGGSVHSGKFIKQ